MQPLPINQFSMTTKDILFPPKKKPVLRVWLGMS
jgi:hypothetical protein